MLLDEAKTMFSVGEYHDNIVNLQGMTARVEEGILGKVCRPIKGASNNNGQSQHFPVIVT